MQAPCYCWSGRQIYSKITKHQLIGNQLRSGNVKIISDAFENEAQSYFNGFESKQVTWFLISTLFIVVIIFHA